MKLIKLNYWMLVCSCLFLFTGCTNSSIDVQISDITYEKWLSRNDGSFTGERELVVVTDAACIKKIVKAFDEMIAGKPEIPYNPIPSRSQHLTIHYSDGTSVEIEANTWSGILVGDKCYDGTEEEIIAFQSIFYDSQTP